MNAYAVLDQPGDTDKHAAKPGSLKPHRENALVYSIQTSGIQGAHCAKYSGQRATQPEAPSDVQMTLPAIAEAEPSQTNQWRSTPVGSNRSKIMNIFYIIGVVVVVIVVAGYLGLHL